MNQGVFVNYNKANEERGPSSEGKDVPHPLQRKVDASPRQRDQQSHLTQLKNAPGKPKPNGLPSILRAGIEAQSGMDMSDVVVHRNSSKPAQLNALAYAQGNNIHLGPGQEQHLPHEAWHVVQQRQGRVKETMQAAGVAVNDDRGLEREADVMGARALSGGAGKQPGMPSDSDRQLGVTTSVQRKAVPVVQRYVTFDSLQEEKVVIGRQGKAGYDSGNFDALVDALFGDPERTPEVHEMLDPYLGAESDICFDSFESAALWVSTKGKEPKATEESSLKPEEKTGSGEERGIVWAFRMEGAPKSGKQLSDVQKFVTPDAAFDATMAELAETIKGHEEQVLVLRQQWADIATKEKAKRVKEIKKLNKVVRKKSLNAGEILALVDAKKDQFDDQIARGEVFASRVYLDGSNMIPADKTSGAVTGLSAGINFSVGSADHASYFATTFDEKGGIVIRFALDKGLWRKWKTEKSGPQKSGIGPRPQNMTTTLNDVAQPGVKYEMQEGKKFFEEVVAKDVPAQVTTLAKNVATWKPTGEDLARTVQRLAKAQRKLEQELTEIDLSAQIFDAERKQNSTAKEQLEKEWVPGPLESLEELYTAMNLTKNALHSVRRKKTASSD